MTIDETARLIGSRVRAGRKVLGMTRRQFAAAADVSERYLNELENGGANVSIRILDKVALALGTDIVRLMVPEDWPGRVTDNGLGSLAGAFGPMTPGERAEAITLLTGYLKERRRGRKGVALLGLRGAGKTTLGRKLAERYGIAFVAITPEVERRAGMSLADLFNLAGADAYRALENEVVSELLGRAEPIVLETAGGIAGNSEALELILGSYRTVWLKAAPEEHLSRVAGQGDTRPMRGNPRALEHLTALLASRESEYARAEWVVDTGGRSIEACLAELEVLAAPVLAQRAPAG